MALVELTLAPLPAHVRTARLVVVAAARRAGLDDDLLDELRLALGEACSRAVVLHSRHAPEVAVRVTITDDPGQLTVTVIDHGPAAGPLLEDLAEDILASQDALDGDDTLSDPDVALTVLAGLVDDYSVGTDGAGGGTTVAMRWPLRRSAIGTSGPGATAASQA